MLFGHNMSDRGYLVRLGICVASDIGDLIVGRALAFFPWEEVPAAAAYTLMWGPIGMLHLAELADFTEQIDAFIPMATLIGLWAGYDKGVWGPKRPQLLAERAAREARQAEKREAKNAKRARSGA